MDGKWAEPFHRVVEISTSLSFVSAREALILEIG